MEACTYFTNGTTDLGEPTLVKQKCSEWVYDTSTFESSLTSEVSII